MNFHTPAHKIFRILILIALLTQAVVFAVPASAAGVAPNPAAEEYLLSELRATGIADLQWIFAPEERGVSGAFLAAALKDPDVQSKPFIYIANAIVVGDLWLSDGILPYNISFMEMEFDGFVNFGGTQLQSITSYNTNFRDSLSFMRSRIDGNLDLRDDVIGESLNFYAAHISGEFLMEGTKVLGTTAMPGTSFPTEVWNTTVDGLASFSNMEFKGDVQFVGSHFGKLEATNAVFGGNVYFDEAVVDQMASFNGTQFLMYAGFTNLSAGTDINFHDAAFKGFATFENAFAGRDANFQGARFDDIANFYYFTAERFSDFSWVTFNKDFQFYYATTAYPFFENTVFNGPVTFEGMHASEDFELLNASYNYPDQPFLANVATVDGVVKFANFTAPAGLQLSDSTFGSFSLTTAEQPDIQFVDLTGTTIENDLSMEKVNLKDFLAEGMTVGGATTLHEVTISKQLDLRNASIGFLKVDEKFSPPTDSDSFNLRGMTYSDIDLGDQGLTDETWKGLLKFINDSAYTPQAYQALSQFLTDKGHPDWAAEVELAQKRRERDEVLTPLSGAWFWSWFLDIFAGYGHRPALAFIWSALVVVTGAIIFRRREDMCPVEQEDVQLNYNPVWYSFALFLPYIDLGIASKWEPSPTRKWARNYKYVHMLLGWVLAPIALLTFGGIIG
jgi:hypothetical protein